MSNYTKATNFATKDTLPTGDANKIVKGTEIDNEFNSISGAISSKADLASPTFTGTPAAPTATSGSNTTQLANTTFVTAAITDTAAATTTFTNKTINLTSNTLVGTIAQFNTALSDGDFATIAGAETLTNKTLTSPTINTGTLSSPTLTGTPVAPTAAAATNTTQVATTAHVFAERTNTATLTNKTLTSPSINSPTISGGSISGITDLAIADGGTGSSTAAGALSNLGAYPASNPSGYTTNVGSVTSVATGNGLQGGTITTSGTLSIDCPSFNTVGSYAFINQNGGTLDCGSNYATGFGFQDFYIFNSAGANAISGTWKWMSNYTTSGGNGIICRVA